MQFDTRRRRARHQASHTGNRQFRRYDRRLSDNVSGGPRHSPDLAQRGRRRGFRESAIAVVGSRQADLAVEQKFPPRRTSSLCARRCGPYRFDVCPASRHEIDFPTERGLDIVDVNEGSEGVPSRVAKKWKGHYETNE
jgi:hypothetical protein